MAKPFTRTQALQNRAFLAALARTGNAREAARTLGVHRATYTKRRARDAAFAAEWDAMLVLAQASLAPPPAAEGRRRAQPGDGGEAPQAPRPYAPRPTRLKSGRLQLRPPRARGLTRRGEQAFLAALSATANVRLSARAAGFSHATFYARRRASPAFAREMRLALQLGYDRLELALLATQAPASHADDAWRHNDPPPIPAMTANQALQLLYLHQKEARLLAEPAHVKRRRGESGDARAFRLAAMYREGQRRDREAFDVAEAERRANGEPWLMGSEDIAPLPALGQVTGWSAAAGEPAHDDTRALFGGWRVK